MLELIKKIDPHIINCFRKYEIILARLAIFVVYFWFGFLKIIGFSPATPLVQALFEKTIDFMPFSTFYILFAIFEVVIGTLFLIRGLERVAILMLGLHLITTAMPLVLLPQIAWQGFMIPTLEGQYMIKNVLILACAVVIGSRLIPMSFPDGKNS